MKATYTVLDNYDHLIERGTNTETVPKRGDTEETLVIIKDIIYKYYKRVAKLAEFLKADTLEQTAYNIWYFCRPLRFGGNINYRLDDPGTEQLRTPSRSWHDRRDGIDCDDYTILCCSILLNLGISPQMVVIAQHGRPSYSHIYTAIGASTDGIEPRGGIVIDPVKTDEFNAHPDNITKCLIMSLEISQLDGLDECRYIKGIIGIGVIAEADEVTRRLMDVQSKLIDDSRKQVAGLGLIAPATMDELTKVRTLIKLNASPERDALLPIMPLIKRVNDDGTFTYINEEAAKVAREHLQAETMDGLGEIGDDNDENFVIDEITGFGKSAKRAAKKAARKEKKAQRKSDKPAKKAERKAKLKEKVKQAIKHPGKAIKEGIKDSLTKFNPLFATVRGALLVVLRVNFRNLAGRMAFGFMTQDEAIKDGHEPENWAKAHDAVQKTIKLYEKIGGEEKALRAAVEKGRKHKAFFGSPKGISGIDELGDLGDGGASAVATAIGAAGTLIAAITKFFKDVKFKKKDGTPAEGETAETADNPEELQTFDVDAFTEENKSLINTVSAANEGYNTMEEREFIRDQVDTINSGASKPTTGTKKWLPFAVGGGVLALFGIIYMSTRKGKKSKK